MLGQPHFHCNFKIQRQGNAYSLSRDSLISTVELFLQSSQAPFFSIGSSRDAYLHIKYLAPNHAACLFTGNNLVLKAGAAFQVTQGNQRHRISPGEEITFNLKEALGSFTWKMTFDEKTRIAGKISEEQEVLPEATICYLESQYGPLQKIDEGGSSAIFKTQDDKVLKILRPGYIDEKKNVVKRFVNAARRYQRILCPDFLPILDIAYHRDYGLCYVVTDYFPGESLKNYLGRKGTLPLKDSIGILRDLAYKLCILQDYGYVCRNLNPANIIRRADGTMRITSFFLLKSDINMTVVHARMVIPNYTAPEQITDPSTVDILSDVFSLGAIFYSLLVGEPPFKAGSSAQYEENVAIGRPLTAEEIQKETPETPLEICEIMAHLLALDKKARPSPSELLSWLSEDKGDQKDVLSDSLMCMIDAECEKLGIPSEVPKALERPLPSASAEPVLEARATEPVLEARATEEESLVSSDHIANMDRQVVKAASGREEPDLFSESALHLIDKICEEAHPPAIKESPPEPLVEMMPEPLVIEPLVESPPKPSVELMPKPFVESGGEGGPLVKPQIESALDPSKWLAPSGLGNTAEKFTPSFVALLEKVNQEVELGGKGTQSAYCIEIIEGPAGTEFMEYNFTGEHTVILGREGDFKIIHDPQISRHHAQIEVLHGKCWLTDLNSANGTCVNGLKISRLAISPGTRFTLGNTVLLFRRNNAMGTLLENPREEITEDDISQLKVLKITSVIPRMNRCTEQRGARRQVTQKITIPEPVEEVKPNLNVSTEEIKPDLTEVSTEEVKPEEVEESPRSETPLTSDKGPQTKTTLSLPNQGQKRRWPSLPSLLVTAIFLLVLFIMTLYAILNILALFLS